MCNKFVFICGPRLLVSLFAVGSLLKMPVAYADQRDQCNTEFVVSYYNQAIESPDLIQKIQLLEKVEQTCPSYDVLTALGDAYRDNHQYQKAVGTYEEMLSNVISNTHLKKATTYLRLMHVHDLQGDRLMVSSYAKKINQLKNSGLQWNENLEAFYQDLYAKNRAAMSSQPLSSNELAKAIQKAPDKSFVVVPTFDIDMSIAFASNQSKLDALSKSQLDALATTLASNMANISNVRVIGHTDVRGDAGYNQRLSEARAKSVANYLRGKLMADAYKITSEGKGEFEPISTEMSAEAHALNRRVSFNIITDIPKK